MLDVHERLIALLEHGVAAAELEAADLSTVLRARYDTPPDGAAEVERIGRELIGCSSRCDRHRTAAAAMTLETAADPRGPAAPIEYRAIGSMRGPLIVVQDVSRRRLGRGRTRSRSTSGEVRHGTVLDVHGDLAVVEVLEGTSGMRLDSARVAFSGAPMRIPVGEGWLGRTCNGRGEPIDGGPPVLGGELRPVAGAPINPARRAPLRARRS